MFFKQSSLKTYAICLGIASLSIWFYFGIYSHSASVDDLSYPKQDLERDLCRIYTDLGLGAEMHKDFKSAIDAYKKALQLIPNASQARNHLAMCLQKIKASASQHCA